MINNWLKFIETTDNMGNFEKKIFIIFFQHRDTVVNTLQASLTTSSDHYFNVLNQQLSAKEAKNRKAPRIRKPWTDKKHW